MKRLLGLLLALVLAVGIWAAIVAADAWRRAPGIVASLDEAGALAFMPESLPAPRTCALLAVQDPAFLTRHGIGLGAGLAGHTTITQSIAKWMFFRRYTPGFLRWRKVKLMVAAAALDRRVSKDVQLSLFVNRTYFGTTAGKQVLGFPAAAQTFFRKPLTRLTDDEYLRLLAMLDAPDRYHAVRAPAANAARVRSLEPVIRARCAAPSPASAPR